MIILISSKFSTDPYPVLYVGWIQYVIESTEIVNAHLLLVDCAAINPLAIIHWMPERVVLVNIYHADLMWDLQYVHEYRKFIGLPPVGLIILNHEQPWTNKSNLISRDTAFLPNDRLNQVYEKFRFVVRQYYYKSLENSAYFLPLGPKNYGFIVGNPDDPIQSKFLPSSLRPIYCGDFWLFPLVHLS